MIKNIIDLLQVAKGDTENIKIAQGKYALPTNFKNAYKQIKKEIQWLQ
jgi:DNA-binding ferritin-like protein (Dps family)